MKTTLIQFFLTFAVWGYGQPREWFSLNETINGDVYKLVAFNGSLVAAGQITMAGTNPVNNIAAWSGTSWLALGSGITDSDGPGLVYDMIVHHDSLFVVGEFDQAGGITTNDVAVWDGTSWSGLGLGSNYSVHAIEVFNDEIYVAGYFDTINGVEARGIAKWNGTGWQNVGAGLRYGNNEFVDELCVYNNKLFASGSIDSAGNIACDNIAAWDGSEWSTIPVIGNPHFGTLIEWDGKLLGSEAIDLGSDIIVEVSSWNGSSYNSFSVQYMNWINDFEIFNGELYCGGSDLAYDYGNTIRKWNGTSWELAGSGINEGVRTLCVYNGDLYAGGFFGWRVARYAELNGVAEDNLAGYPATIFPNPAGEFTTVSLKLPGDAFVDIVLMDWQGRRYQLISNIHCNKGYQEIDLNLENLDAGLYLVQLKVNNQIHFEKIIIE